MSDPLSQQGGERWEALEKAWIQWWSGLEHRKGDRAALRRCHSVLEVSLEPAFHDLLKKLEKAGTEERRDRIAATAGIVAQVTTNSPGRSLADSMATASGDKPRVSDARFRRLLRLETPDELLHELPRVLRMLGATAPVASLATDVMFWSDRIRKKWALHYYEKAAREQK